MGLCCCGFTSGYSTLDDDTEAYQTKMFNLKRDSMFIEDNQIIEYNFSQLISYKTGRLNFEHEAEKGSHIIEVTNNNEENGTLVFSVKMRDTKTRNYKVPPMMVILMFFLTFNFERQFNYIIN